jgi:hypothetical protein
MRLITVGICKLDPARTIWMELAANEANLLVIFCTEVTHVEKENFGHLAKHIERGIVGENLLLDTLHVVLR